MITIGTPSFRPDIHIPDGEPHVMSDGKLYVYGSYDADMENYLQRGVSCGIHAGRETLDGA